jgi:uncharacterized protein involved in exopolysaccharide biosynthesis
MLIAPPVWTATSRVLLNVAKPDPVSGENIAGDASKNYPSTAAQLVTDYSVAGRVVDDLGMLSDPGLIKAYQSRPADDTRDFKRWAEQIIISNTKAKFLQDSDILEIKYSSNSPESAKITADALRKAFIDTSLAFKRQTAQTNADWFAGQAIKAKADLDSAITAETDFERAHGVAMANSKVDMDTARLEAMAGQGASIPPTPPIQQGTSAAGMELARLDAEIATQSKELGPNNPAIMQLHAQRANMATVLAKEQAGNEALKHIAESDASVIARQVAAQKAKVVAESDTIGKLSQLQTEVDLRREAFDKTSARAAELRMQALSVDVGLNPLTSAAVPNSPDFPKTLLIIPGSFVLGLAVGVLLSLLIEFFGRRVRGVEDLSSTLEAPVLAVIAGPQVARPTGLRGRILDWIYSIPPLRQRTAHA